MTSIIQSHETVDEMAVKLLSAASIMEGAAPSVAGTGLSRSWARYASACRGSGNVADGLTDQLTADEHPFHRLDRFWLLTQLRNLAGCEALIGVAISDLGDGPLSDTDREAMTAFSGANMAVKEAGWVLHRLILMEIEMAA